MNVSSLPEPNIIIDQNIIDQNIIDQDITDQNITDQNTTDSNSRTPKPKKVLTPSSHHHHHQHHQLNQDYCSTCGNGGQLMCCDSCPRAFHFTCLVPPLDIDNTPQGNWYCRVCYAEENPPSGPQGLFQELIEKARSSNPKSFSLPENLRNTFEGVGTGQYGEYVDTLRMKKLKNGELKEYDYCEFRKDEYGQWKKCYICERGPCQIQPMISCDYCSLSWHFDCLDPPMVIRPPISKKWMCPAHADHILPPTRKFKSDKNLPFSDNTIVQLPRKNLVECDPEFFLNDRKHRVPKYGVKLNYISQIIGKVKQEKLEMEERQIREDLEVILSNIK